MVFTEEHRIIIKYLRIKHGHGPQKIVDDHPEFEWKVNVVKTLLAKIDKTGDMSNARKDREGPEHHVPKKMLPWSKK